MISALRVNWAQVGCVINTYHAGSVFQEMTFGIFSLNFLGFDSSEGHNLHELSSHIFLEE